MSGHHSPFLRNLAEATLRYRWAILLLNILALAWLLTGMAARGKEFGDHIAYMRALRESPQVADTAHVIPPPIFNADYHVWFDKDNPDLVAFDRFQKVFAKEELALVAVAAKEGDIFDNRHLATLRTLTERFWTVPYVNRVDGLVNFNYTTADGDELLVEDFIPSTPLAEADLAEKKRVALADPILSKFLLSRDAGMTQIALRVIVPEGYPEGHIEAKRAMDSLVQLARAENPGLDFRLGGTVVMNTAFNEFAQKDSQTLVPLMFLIIILALAFLLRSFWGTVLPMGLLVTSILFPIALFVGVMGMSLNNASVNVVQILVTIAIADSVHILTIFFQGMKQGMKRNEAIVHTFQVNFIPCLITSATTAAGFFSLLLQDVPPFRDLGLFAGAGSLYAFLASVFTLPALLSLIPFRARAKAAAPATGSAGAAATPQPAAGSPDRGALLPQWPVAWVDRIDRRKKSIAWASLFLALASLGLFTRLVVDSSAVKFFSEETEFRQATEYIDGNIIGTNPYEFGFDAGSEGGVYDPAFLKKLERFQEYLLSRPDFRFTYVSSIVDVVKRLNQTLHGGDPAYYAIPDRDSVTAEGDTLRARNLIAQYILLYTLSLPQGMDLTNQVNVDNSKARVTAFQQQLTSSRQTAVAAEINAWLDREMPEAGARTLGVPIMFGNMMEMAMPGMLKGAATSLLLITFMLVVTFRSLRAGLLSMIPNVLPVVVMYGIIGLSGYMVNLSVAVVAMITLGIAVDDTVHFMQHYLEGIRQGLPRKQAIVRSFQECGLAIVFTSIILVAGFLSLTLSDFAVNQDLGMFCSLVWVLALLAEFTVLPAIILLIGERKAAKEAAAAAMAPSGKAAAAAA
jgi:predicted RND superfamily exporter protein